MKKQIDMVRDFHKAFGAYYQDTYGQKAPEEIIELRIKLMKEELSEVEESIREGQSINETAKELADLLYVVYGTISALGLGEKMEEIFAEVHKSNMSKLDDNGKPITREDGKILKSKNYKKPDLEKILD